MKIPTENISNQSNYIVKAGDTLWSIANRFNTTINKLRQLNNLVTDVLSIGQVLLTK